MGISSDNLESTFSLGDSNGGPPPGFVEAVKDALDHLYDFDKLNSHPLARWILPGRLPAGVSHAHALRQRLVDAIERLNPGNRVPSSAKQNRSFQILERRYIEAIPFREVMRTLTLSQAHYHREQRHALQMLAVYLWDTLPRKPVSHPGSTPSVGGQLGASSSPEGEVSNGEAVTDPCDDEVSLGTFLEEVAHLLGPIGAPERVRISVALPEEEVVVNTSRTTLRHAVIGAVLHLLDEARDGELTLAVETWAPVVSIEIRYRGPAPGEVAGEREGAEKLQLCQRLIRSIGGELQLNNTAMGGAHISLSFPRRGIVLLVIEDNPSMIQLIGRYLADQQYRVLSAGSVEEGLVAARASHPDVILLDVMMPHRDGWDALQLLRHHPETARIPVVVCTVLAEQQLARALGAAEFIRKPLTRPALLQALGRCLSHPSTGESQGGRAPLSASE